MKKLSRKRFNPAKISFFLIRMAAILFLSGAYFCSAALADVKSADNEYDQWDKLGRGLANVVFSPLEIVYQPYQMASEERIPVAILGGACKGVARMGVRLGVGLFEILTFPAAWPSEYRPVLEPEFVIPPSS